MWSGEDFLAQTSVAYARSSKVVSWYGDTEADEGWELWKLMEFRQRRA